MATEPVTHISEDEMRREIEVLAGLVRSKEMYNRHLQTDYREYGVWRPIFSVLMNFTHGTFKSHVQRELRDRKLVAYTAEARLLLRQPDTRAELCPPLLDLEITLSKLSVRTTEQTATEIGALLTRRANAPEAGDTVLLAANSSARLIAVSSWLIARTGITDYCRTHA